MYYIEEDFTKILLYMGIKGDQIHEEASFVNDFGFEDSQFTCLALYIAIYFKINIRERDYAELVTIGSTMKFIKRKLYAYDNAG